MFIYNINIDGVYPLDYRDCSKNSYGWGCANYIIKNDNMKYQIDVQDHTFDYNTFDVFQEN